MTVNFLVASDSRYHKFYCTQITCSTQGIAFTVVFYY